MEKERKVWIIGHKNPDTDSICAAISYAELKNRKEKGSYVAKRAGHVSEETKFVLDYFKVQKPELVTDVGAQVKDIEIRNTAGVDANISLRKAWELMKNLNVVSLPVTNIENKLKGLIVTGDIATSYMDVYDNRILATARTQYRNIVETVNGVLITGNEHGYFLQGKVLVSTGSAELMEDYVNENDLVILGNREDAQKCALELNAACMIVCYGSNITQEVLDLAKEKDCVLISTPYDTFTVARLIHQSMPIKHFMKKENLITFELNDFIDDVKDTMSQIRHRDFPVVDEDGTYIGMVSRRNLLSMQKKQIIMVDHNEKTQAVDGLMGAEILEIIDHHRLGSLETTGPVYFRNQPLGCTNTIIYLMYQEQNEEIPKHIAGLMLSAIISDTLMFRSPTCTPIDKMVAEKLSEIAGVEIEPYAKQMFKAGSNFQKKTIDEIFYTDFKTFNAGEKNFGVSQISAMSAEELDPVREKVESFMGKVLDEKRLDMVFVMLTDILEETTRLVCVGTGATTIAETAFQQAKTDNFYLLLGVVSRKKQLIPALINALQQ